MLIRKSNIIYYTYNILTAKYLETWVNAESWSLWTCLAPINDIFMLAILTTYHTCTLRQGGVHRQCTNPGLTNLIFWVFTCFFGTTTLWYTVLSEI